MSKILQSKFDQFKRENINLLEIENIDDNDNNYKSNGISLNFNYENLKIFKNYNGKTIYLALTFDSHTLRKLKPLHNSILQVLSSYRNEVLDNIENGLVMDIFNNDTQDINHDFNSDYPTIKHPANFSEVSETYKTYLRDQFNYSFNHLGDLNNLHISIGSLHNQLYFDKDKLSLYNYLHTTIDSNKKFNVRREIAANLRQRHDFKFYLKHINLEKGPTQSTFSL
ncbi:uncharacterized protein ASCRUDRAFT_76167 [Ascoidea rubescens DSM 1968]|uniref:Uncharacterized protein n=1 Tax=Ascoidea rubescens DSM 1968 TaxID=1344418 RepID=A0A1D2VGL8_9ASCO|nr:hypothetical protein ASCRUDRAFT_76167 [Ascoidea rubescens DSM 1968]ODV60804.1 hypothetical protein ASCRUDRAFT_76167 [Ascoidea rubescens DSM 1968]